MNADERVKFESEIGRFLPCSAADIAKSWPPFTERKVLKVACTMLALQHELPRNELWTTTKAVLRAREQYRRSAELPSPGKQYEDGQLTATRLYMEDLRAALKKADAALAAVWDDLLVMPCFDDDAQDALPELGDALRTVLRGMAIPRKVHNDGTLTVPTYWQQRGQQRAAALAVGVWERREIPKPLTWNRNFSLRKRARSARTGEPPPGDRPSPFALAFLPWMLLLGIGNPERPERAWGLLRWAVERRRGQG